LGEERVRVEFYLTPAHMGVVKFIIYFVF
jgi:hypothetical protein